MLDGVLSLIPGARVGFIGLYRDEETLQPVEYYVKLPNDIADRDVILLDPMLATGNSTAAAVVTVKSAGADLGPADRADRDARGDRPDPSRPSRCRHRGRIGRSRLEREGLHRPGPRGRRRPALRHEVGGGWLTLRDNPEVLYGAAIALLIVVLLTPAVGGMARLLGVVDNPDARRLNRRPIPAAGRARDLPGDPRAGPRLPRPVGRDARHPARRRGGLRRRRSRRLPRARPGAEARGSGSRSRDPDRVRRLDRPLHVPVPRRRRRAAAGSASR